MTAEPSGAGRPDRRGVLEQLQACSEDAEIWWDSLPRAYGSWKRLVLEQAPAERRPAITARLGELFDPARTESTLFRGATTNPILLSNVLLQDSLLWSDAIRARLSQSNELRPADDPLSFVSRKIVSDGAATLEPLWKSSGGRFGWMSAQVDPVNIFDAAAMVDEGVSLAGIAPNVMVKIPGSDAGYRALEELAARGISINNTLTYSVAQLRAYAEALARGLAVARDRGIDLTRWRAVYTFMAARFGEQGLLSQQAVDRGQTLSPDDLRWAEVAMIKRMCAITAREGWPLKILVSSMRVSDREPLCIHLQETAGAPIVYTCPPAFLSELIAREDSCGALDSEAHARPVPAERRRRFEDLPYFRSCFEEDGLRRSDFDRMTPLLATLSDFMRGRERAADFVRRAATA